MVLAIKGKRFRPLFDIPASSYKPWLLGLKLPVRFYLIGHSLPFAKVCFWALVWKTKQRGQMANLVRKIFAKFQP
jgi:hypothetical protein